MVVACGLCTVIRFFNPLILEHQENNSCYALQKENNAICGFECAIIAIVCVHSYIFIHLFILSTDSSQINMISFNFQFWFLIKFSIHLNLEKQISSQYVWGISLACSQMEEKVQSEELVEAFSVFHKNGDGSISPWEVQQVLLSLGLKEGQDLESCEMMITRFDKNSDGRIDFEEFENIMTMMDKSL